MPKDENAERINYQTMLFSLFFRSYFSLIFVLRRRLPINPSECSASRADSTLCPYLVRLFPLYKVYRCFNTIIPVNVLVYSNSLGDNVNSLLYNGFIEELVDILQLPDKNMLVSLSPTVGSASTTVVHPVSVKYMSCL